MRKPSLAWLVALILTTPIISAANSAELELEWHEPERFSDIEPGNDNRERFRNRVLEGLEGIFQQNAERLPDDQKLWVKVTDVDLAGVVEPVRQGGGMQNMRVVRQGHLPSISFEYKLSDADGNVIQEGEERIRGRSPADQMRGQRGDMEFLKHENDMISRWFRRNLEDS